MSKKVDTSLIEYAYTHLNQDLIPKGNKEYENMISGALYNPMDPELIYKRTVSNEYCDEYSGIKLRDIVKEVSQDVSGKDYKELLLVDDYRTKSIQLLTERRNDVLKKHILGSMGKNTYIEPPFAVDYGMNISIGDNFYCNFNCVFLDCSLITVGNNVMLGPGVNLLTASHPLDSYGRNRMGVELAYAIDIGDECWLGANVIICPGVKIGKRCVVAAGSVVTKSFGDGLLLAGVPAKAIKTIEEPNDPEIQKVQGAA